MEFEMLPQTMRGQDASPQKLTNIDLRVVYSDHPGGSCEPRLSRGCAGAGWAGTSAANFLALIRKDRMCIDMWYLACVSAKYERYVMELELPD